MAKHRIQIPSCMISYQPLLSFQNSASQVRIVLLYISTHLVHIILLSYQKFSFNTFYIHFFLLPYNFSNSVWTQTIMNSFEGPVLMIPFIMGKHSILFILQYLSENLTNSLLFGFIHRTMFYSAAHFDSVFIFLLYFSIYYLYIYQLT